MTNYLQEIWKCRYFWISLVRSDLRTRYRRSVLGVGWSLLHPLLMTAVLCTVFSTLFGLPVREYGPFILTGLTFWAFITGCTMTGSQCFFHGETYIRQYPAPMAIYPLRAMLGAAFHFVLALAVAIVLTCALQGFSNLAGLAHLIPSLLVILVFGWSVAVISGLANVFFPDAHHLFEVGLQIMFYATPIMYPPHLLRERGMGFLVDLNPLNHFLALVRAPILEGHAPGMLAMSIAALTAAAALGAASMLLVRLERRLIFHL